MLDSIRFFLWKIKEMSRILWQVYVRKGMNSNPHMADGFGRYNDFSGFIRWGGTNAAVDGASFTLCDFPRDNHYIIWSGGIWRHGHWHDGMWLGGTWLSGTWRNGIWKSGMDSNGIAHEDDDSPDRW